MPTMNMIQAINDALRLEMRRDPDVVVLGEDVGKVGGVFRATQGLCDEFGDDRVIDTPLAEGGIIGTAIGMALYGLRPVPEIQFADFIFPAFDQIVNEVAKFRYRSGGQYACPMVIRTPYGGGIRGGHYHSQSPEALFIHIAGLKVVVPSNPYDAKGLLLARSATRTRCSSSSRSASTAPRRARCPRASTWCRSARRKVTREGSARHARSPGARCCYEADAGRARGRGGGHRLRGHRPAHAAAARHRDHRRSVKKTGRVVVVHEAPRTCGFGAELAALIQEKCFLHLEAPIARVTGFDTPFPYTLENEYLPRAPRILKAIREVVTY